MPKNYKQKKQLIEKLNLTQDLSYIYQVYVEMSENKGEVVSDHELDDLCIDEAFLEGYLREERHLTDSDRELMHSIASDCTDAYYS